MIRISKDLTILSFGGGQDSWALLCLLIYDKAFRRRYAPGRILVIMSDTGNEWQQTLDAVKRAQALCAEHGIEFVHITKDMGYHIPSWPSLQERMVLSNTCGGASMKASCTDKLKIQVIYSYLEAWIGRTYGYVSGRKRALKEYARIHGRIRVMIGFAAGEERRIVSPERVLERETKTPWWRAIQIIYPLIDRGMDRTACQDYIAQCGHVAPMPSNCMQCPWQSPKELLLLSRERPDVFDDWCERERIKLAWWADKVEQGKNHGVFGAKTLREKLAQAVAQYGHLTTQELWTERFSRGHCVKSSY